MLHEELRFALKSMNLVGPAAVAVGNGNNGCCG